MKHLNSLRKQQGSTLLMTLIMLVLLMLLVVSAINWSTINMRITGNMQSMNEARTAAEMAINQVLSAPISATAQTVQVDINNDGTNDYTVVVPVPSCVGDKLSKDTGAEAPAIRDSVWEVQANVTDNRTGASVSMTQGVNVFAGGSCV